MIVTCDGCRTKYLLSDDRVPERGVRVRCPKCRFVWRLMPAVAADSIFEVSGSDFTAEPPAAQEQRGGWAALAEERSAPMGAAMMEAAPEEIEMRDRQGAPGRQEASESPELRKRRERAKRLARVFVSDILVYNREKRDRGLAGGDLMTVLGTEIKKSWEAYKEKVGPDLAESNEYFRTALNEILADGKKVF